MRLRVIRKFSRRSSGLDRGNVGSRAAEMIYAIFMLLVLATLSASWCGHRLELPLFVVTFVWMLTHLVSDMTTTLTLSF